MNILVTSDLHGDTGDKGQLKTFEQLLQCIELTMYEHGCTGLVVNGDFWDEKHGIVWEVLSLIRKYLLRWANKGWIIIWVRGNHEVSIKTQPEKSMVEFFDIHENIKIANSPRILDFSGHILACLPWYLPEPFIKRAAAMATAIQSRLDRGAHSAVLLTHIGLREGNASPSNVYYVNQRVEVKHLFPEVYDYVLCGDYHQQQRLAPNAWYIGAPRQRAFGDVPYQKPFIIGYYGSEVKLFQVPLERVEQLPVYETMELETEDDLRTLQMAVSGAITSDWDYGSNDYIRLKVAPELRGIARQAFPYPRWQIDVIPTLRGSSNPAGRLEGIKENDSEAVLDVWLRSNGLDKDPVYRDTALKYLIEAVEL